MLIPYKDLKEYLEDIINNWFDNYKKLRSVYELFLGTYYNDHLHPHFYFLSLIHAIEAFHRLAHEYDGKYLSNDDYEPVNVALNRAITTIMSGGKAYPEGFKEALEGRIKYGNEYLSIIGKVLMKESTRLSTYLKRIS
jgi:hypothetical protein